MDSNLRELVSNPKAQKRTALSCLLEAQSIPLLQKSRELFNGQTKHHWVRPFCMLFYIILPNSSQNFSLFLINNVVLSFIAFWNRKIIFENGPKNLEDYIVHRYSRDATFRELWVRHGV